MKSTQQVSKQPAFKIVFAGDSGVGKTSIVSSFIQKKIKSKTIGANVYVKQIPNSEIKLEIWDTSGDCRLRSLINSYYKKADAVILVFDCGNASSFYNCKFWNDEIMKNVAPNCLKYLVNTKKDLIKKEICVEEDEFTSINITQKKKNLMNS